MCFIRLGLLHCKGQSPSGSPMHSAKSHTFLILTPLLAFHISKNTHFIKMLIGVLVFIVLDCRISKAIPT